MDGRKFEPWNNFFTHINILFYCNFFIIIFFYLHLNLFLFCGIFG